MWPLRFSSHLLVFWRFAALDVGGEPNYITQRLLIVHWNQTLTRDINITLSNVFQVARITWFWEMVCSPLYLQWFVVQMKIIWTYTVN